MVMTYTMSAQKNIDMTVRTRSPTSSEQAPCRRMGRAVQLGAASCQRPVVTRGILTANRYTRKGVSLHSGCHENKKGVKKAEVEQTRWLSE